MRIQQIDALRGFALFGILVVNIFVFHAPYSHYGAFYGKFEGIDANTFEYMIFLFGGKFMFIYAFLFGYGFWLQYQQKVNMPRFVNYWATRMLLLAGIGILHLLLLSFGDILLPYALLGLSLPFWGKQSNTTLIICFFIINLIPFYEFLARFFFDYESVFTQPVVSLEEYIKVNRSGSYIDIMILRLKDYFSFGNEKLIWYVPKELSLFLAGVLAARMQVAELAFKRWVLLFLFVAFSFTVLMYLFSDNIIAFFDYEEKLLDRILLGLIIHFSEVFHGFLYILAFWLIWKISVFSRLLHFFTYPGRMSLTNYLCQSAICLFIFSGLDYYGQLTPTDLLLLALGIYLLQVILSYFWLKKKKQGPVEYIWRKLSNALSIGEVK